MTNPQKQNYLFKYQNLSNPDLFVEGKPKAVWGTFFLKTLSLVINKHHHFLL